MQSIAQGKGTVLINGRCIAIHGDIKAGTIAKLQTWEAERVINKVHPGACDLVVVFIYIVDDACGQSTIELGKPGKSFSSQYLTSHLHSVEC